MQTFGEKYKITEGTRTVGSSGMYSGIAYEYTIPETLEVRELHVPSGASLILTLLNDLRKA